MKTNAYLNFILTVIAVCLVVLTLKQFSIIPGVQAADTRNSQPEYALVPLNADGAVEVNIHSFDNELNVNLEKVGGYGCYNGIPVLEKKE